jgi:hypothetical protein
MPVHWIYCSAWLCPKFKMISNTFEMTGKGLLKKRNLLPLLA